MRLEDKNIPWGTGIFKRTKRVTLELSNLCNWSKEHERCPAHYYKEHVILPERIVRNVLETCRAYSFKGVIAFHIYNEPGIDPRLMYFIKLTKEMLPGSFIFLLTNGWYFTQTLAEEYEQHGVDFIDISTYNPEDAKKIKGVSLSIPIRVLEEPLDDRMTWYGKEVKERIRHPCYYPLYDICISCKGFVVLCPYDWKRVIRFGDLNKESLKKILQKKEMRAIYEDLSAGRRTREICRGCPRSRGEPYAE